jgi:hypothetical protein
MTRLAPPDWRRRIADVDEAESLPDRVGIDNVPAVRRGGDDLGGVPVRNVEGPDEPERRHRSWGVGTVAVSAR